MHVEKGRTPARADPAPDASARHAATRQGDLDALEAHETFRNELASVAPDGRRRWIYARQPSGRLYRARTFVSVLLLTFLFAAPFVQVNGLPLVLLNVIERRFALFGLLFWPQDFYLIVLLALVVLVGLALSTAAVGRVWCGWLCPQTVFMEMVFRRIEYLIDGSAEQQVRRSRGPWTFARAWRYALKHAIFFGLSFAIANVFLAYIIGAEALHRIVTAPPREHLGGLVAITIFSAVFYAVFARFREQACILACPYGRVMSSLIDRDTITVTYDTVRGEPRGRLVRASAAASANTAAAPASPAATRGDCVDCHQCVTVCPTGIDIRNGVQLECVNCTACMDACDDVMDRVGRPRGLIRWTSHAALRARHDATGETLKDADTRGAPRCPPEGQHARVHPARRRWLTPRVSAYASVWLLLVIGLVVLMAQRRAVDTLILRQSGTLFTTAGADEIVNFYTVQVFNRTSADQPFAIVATQPEGARVQALGPLDRVGPHALLDTRLLVAVPRAHLAGASTPVRFEVRVPGHAPQLIESSMVGPAGSKGAGAGAAHRGQ